VYATRKAYGINVAHYVPFKISLPNRQTRQFYSSKVQLYRKKAGVILEPISHNTSLVVWGQNLQSTVDYRFSHKELAMVRLSPYTKSVIVGLILSDGSISFASETNKNPRL